MIKHQFKKGPQKLLAFFCLGVSLGYGVPFWLSEVRHPVLAKNAIEVCFSPKSMYPGEEGCDDMLINAIHEAKDSIHIFIFSFTLPSVRDAILKALQRGVKVFIITDGRQSNGPSAKAILNSLANHVHGIYRDQRPGTAHNKYTIIDKETVLTGSFNYSGNGIEKNRENLLKFNDEPDFAGEFYKNWETSQKASQVYAYKEL